LFRGELALGLDRDRIELGARHDLLLLLLARLLVWLGLRARPLLGPLLGLGLSGLLGRTVVLGGGVFGERLLGGGLLLGRLLLVRLLLLGGPLVRGAVPLLLLVVLHHVSMWSCSGFCAW